MELLLPNSGNITISTCNNLTDYDTVLRIYNTSGLNTQLHANDDSCNSTKSQIAASLAAGTYYVVVEGLGGAEGNFELSITCMDLTGK